MEIFRRKSFFTSSDDNAWHTVASLRCHLQILQTDVCVSCVNLIESARRVGVYLAATLVTATTSFAAQQLSTSVCSYAREDFLAVELARHDGTLLDHPWTVRQARSGTRRCMLR